MRRCFLTLWLLAGIFCAAAAAQVYDLRTDREPIASTASQRWRFHPGDNPAWASPDLDDASWQLLKADAPWSSQGYRGLSGYAWYRFQVETPPGMPQLAIRLPSLATEYQVFANGKLIGGCGDLTQDPAPWRCRPQVINLPDPVGGKAITVALRVWHWRGWAGYTGGGPARAGSLGEQKLVHKKQADESKINRISFMPYWILCLLYLTGAVASFFLFLWRRGEREYGWFALMLLFEGIEFGWSYFFWQRSMPVSIADGIDDLLNTAGWTAAIFFFAEFLRARQTLMFRLMLGVVSSRLVLQFLIITFPWFLLHVGITNTIETLILLCPTTWVLVLLIRRATQRVIDAIFLAIPVAILYGSGLVASVLSIFQQLGLQVPQFTDFRLVIAPFPLDVSEIASFLFLIGMLAILINRFTRTRRVEERYASEFESARHVQEVLVPVQLGSIPGFTVEAEYRPARSVGGDFYQVLPGDDGGLLIVVGDVAGKGMPAAMLVAMIVGAIRTQAVFSMDPGTMLQALNERLCGHSSGGFSTCLVAYISKLGEMTMSNAGHLSPYLNGREMSLPAELPLGIEFGTRYASEKFQLVGGDRLTFISDGIVEATNAKRELFGFERTEAISTQPATEIITVAQAFGQIDDITVVTAAFGV